MQRKATAEIKPHVAALHQQNLAQKVRYKQHMYDIPDDKVCNLAETSCCVLPLAEKGWARKKRLLCKSVTAACKPLVRAADACLLAIGLSS
eukprot:3951374-Amphidinium_carterae.2